MLSVCLVCLSRPISTKCTSHILSCMLDMDMDMDYFREVFDVTF